MPGYSLPGYRWDNDEDDKSTNYHRPQRKRGRYRDDQNPQFWSHYSQCPTQSKDSSRGSHHSGKRWRQQHEQNIAHYATDKIDRQELVFSHQLKQVTSEEVEGYHVSYDMPKAAMNKQVAYYRPGLREEGCRLEPKKQDNVSVYKGDDK